jgi:hypothetical protein
MGSPKERRMVILKLTDSHLGYYSETRRDLLRRMVKQKGLSLARLMEKLIPMEIQKERHLHWEILKGLVMVKLTHSAMLMVKQMVKCSHKDQLHFQESRKY